MAAWPDMVAAALGKDPTKVDRSASYMARYVAKNVVAAGVAQRCLVQLAYVIGVADPVSVMIDTYGTGRVDEERWCMYTELFPSNRLASSPISIYGDRSSGILQPMDILGAMSRSSPGNAPIKPRNCARLWAYDEHWLDKGVTMDYDVRDLGLAPKGKARVEWAAQSMPVLKLVHQRFAAERPLAGMRLAACLHVTTETGNLMRVLKAGGAESRLRLESPQHARRGGGLAGGR